MQRAAPALPGTRGASTVPRCSSSQGIEKNKPLVTWELNPFPRQKGKGEASADGGCSAELGGCCGRRGNGSGAASGESPQVSSPGAAEEPRLQTASDSRNDSLRAALQGWGYSRCSPFPDGNQLSGAPRPTCRSQHSRSLAERSRSVTTPRSHGTPLLKTEGTSGDGEKSDVSKGRGKLTGNRPLVGLVLFFGSPPAGFPSKVQAWGDAGMQPKGRKEPGGFVPLRTDTKPRHPGSTRGWGRDAGLRKAALRAPKGGVGRRGYPPPPGCPPRPRGPAARRGRGGPFGARLRPARGARARGSSARGSLRVWGRPGFSAAVFCVSSAGSGTRFSPGGEHGEKKK